MPAFTIIKNDVCQRIIKKHDRKIDGILTTAHEQVTSNLAEGESFVEGAYPLDIYKFVDGSPVELTQIELNEKQPPPTKLTDVYIDEYAQAVALAGIATLATLPPPENWVAQDAVNAINQAAGRARFRFISQGLLVNEEYQLAANQVKEWRTAGNPENDVPPTLASWANASGMTTELAAQNIEQTAAAYNSALESIRDIRLNGNAAVNAASTDFVTVAQTYIDTLDAI